MSDLIGNFRIERGKRVLLRAPVLTQSGYGVHSRQIARWLLGRPNIELFVEALSWGSTPWMLDEGGLDGLAGRIMDHCTLLEGNQRYDVTVQVQLPNEWDPRLGAFNVGVTAGVETDRCNPEWLNAINRMDLVIVPSEHTKRVFAASGDVRTKIVVIPESFPDVFLDQPKAVDFGIEPEFNFLVVGQFTSHGADSDRKRMQETVRWLAQAFDGDDSVGIVVKANMGKNTRIDRNLCKRVLTEALPKRTDGFPRVRLVHGSLSDGEMLSLYTHPKIKAYVTCTRGEGYGLTLLEAAACGLPVVATNWSGHLDFMNLGKFVKLSYSLDEIPKQRIDSNIFMAGSRWASVDERDFKMKVKKLRDSCATPKEWASELAVKLKANFSYANVARSYDALLGEAI